MSIRFSRVCFVVLVLVFSVMSLSAQAAWLRSPLQGMPRINAWFDADGTQNGYDYRYDGVRVYNTLYYSSQWAPGGYNYYYDGHNGVDFNVSTGTQVYATSSGYVYQIQSTCVVGDSYCGNGYGNHVRIRHSDQSVTISAHLSSVQVSLGAYVNCGSQIGSSGNTGWSYGPHLHFEYRSSTSETRLDPFNYWYYIQFVQDALNPSGWMWYPTTICY